MRVATVVCITLLTAAAGCSEKTSTAKPPDTAALRAGVDSAADRLLVALRTNNSDSLVALLSDEIVIMPPGEPVLKGKDAVRTWFNQFLSQMKTTKLDITSREVLIDGEFATEIAGFVWTLQPVSGTTIVDSGSYIQVWRHMPDGRWLFHREIWNSSAPSPEG